MKQTITPVSSTGLDNIKTLRKVLLTLKFDMKMDLRMRLLDTPIALGIIHKGVFSRFENFALSTQYNFWI